MSRSGYSWDNAGDANLYRANVDRALAGKRGQKMLLDLLEALEAMSVKRLVAGKFADEIEVCALGALGHARGLDMDRWDFLAEHELDEALYRMLSKAFRIPEILAREIMWVNDEGYWVGNETPEHRWERVRDWVFRQINV